MPRMSKKRKHELSFYLNVICTQFSGHWMKNE